MTTTGQMLLQAIVEDPDADDLRLIYADWLDDHGQPGDSARAEFIRVQIRLAAMDVDDPGWHALQVRERDLLLDHRTRWLADLMGLFARISWEDEPQFARGFPERLNLTGKQFQSLAPMILALTPIANLALRGRLKAADVAVCPELAHVHGFALSGEPSSELEKFLRLPQVKIRRLNLVSGGLKPLRVLADWPGAADLRELEIGTPVTDVGLMTLLAGAPALANLDRLRLCGRDLDTAGLRALTRWSLPPSVRLDLALGAPEAEGMRLLADWPAFAGLRSLTLRAGGVTFASLAQMPPTSHLRELIAEWSISPTEAAVLATLPHLSRLRRLCLPRNPLGDAGVRHLAGSPYLAEVEHLDLERTQVGDAGLLALAGSSLRPRNLDLSDNPFGLAGLTALAGSPFLGRVNELFLTGCELGEAELTALARSDHLKEVHTLRLDENAIGEAGLLALTKAAWASRLRTLDVSGNRLPNRAIAALVESSLLSELRVLDLDQTGIGNAPVQSLAKCPQAVRLRRLAIDHNQITDAGFLALAESPYLDHLDELIVHSNRNTARGLQALWDRFGDRVRPQPERSR